MNIIELVKEYVLEKSNEYSYKFLFIVLFAASFAFVLQRCKQRGLRAKPIPLKWRAS